jgi:ribosomal protein S18 acetylase RimI-like enzyme
MSMTGNATTSTKLEVNSFTGWLIPMVETVRMILRVREVSPVEPAFDAVCALFDDYRAHYGRRRAPRDVRIWLGAQVAAGRLAVYAAAVDGTPRAVATATESSASLALGTAWTIRDLWVDPEFRRCGLATELVRAVARAARDAGALRLGLQTEVGNEAALELYLRLGFERVTGLEILAYDLTGH